MTIEHLHFNVPVPVDLTQPVHVQLAEALGQQQFTQEVLAEGVYDLTPTLGGIRTRLRHELTVFAKGNGIYRFFDRGERATMSIAAPPAQERVIYAGGATSRLPEDAPIAAVIGRFPDTNLATVHDLLIHRPGLSPRPTRRPRQQGRSGA